MGTNSAPLMLDLFLYCYKGDFMSHLHKSKSNIYKVWPYRYVKRTIDNPEFEKHIPDIYAT